LLLGRQSPSPIPFPHVVMNLFCPSPIPFPHVVTDSLQVMNSCDQTFPTYYQWYMHIDTSKEMLIEHKNRRGAFVPPDWHRQNHSRSNQLRVQV
jgi:hypothetical protein